MITHRWTVTAIDYAPTEIEEADSDLKKEEPLHSDIGSDAFSMGRLTINTPNL